MKRAIDSPLTNIQVQIKPESFDNNIFGNRNQEIFLLDFISLLAINLKTEELIHFQSLLSNEIDTRTSIIREMIPNDVWSTIFRLIAHNEDISSSLPIKQVCNRWMNCFNESIHETIILKKNSLNLILNLPGLRSLTIQSPREVTLEIFQKSFVSLQTLILNSPAISCSSEISTEIWSQLTCLNTLQISFTEFFPSKRIIHDENIVHLTTLQYLKIGGAWIESDSLIKLVHLKKLTLSYPYEQLFSIVGRDFEIIDYLKELEEIELRKLKSYNFFKINEIQEKYAHVRFRWVMLDGPTGLRYYEGNFDEDNNISVKGIMKLCDGSVYDGEWKNGTGE